MPAKHRTFREPIRAALDLRTWATALLASAAGPGEETWERARACGPEAWRLFLSTERCGIPLHRRLGSLARERLRPDASALLRQAAAVETQRVVSARAQLRSIGELAELHGWTVAPLKGGAAVWRGCDLDLTDIDLLAPPPSDQALFAALEARGYRAVHAAGSLQLATQALPNATQLEIHVAIPGLEHDGVESRLHPPATGGLWSLAPADHLWHVLLHSTVGHPERRGSIREVLLLGEAIRACPGEALRLVERRAAEHPAAAQLVPVLAQASAFMDRSADRRDDPFHAVAAANYLIGHLFGRRAFPQLAVTPLLRAVHGRLGPPGREAITRDHGFGLDWPSGFGPLSAVQRRSPRLGRLTRRTLRNAPIVALAPLGAWIAREARLIASDAPPREPSSPTS